ncbi:MAG TPA: hypothetical protein PK289_00535 [Bacteroidia bacterium]|jgi:hypothetical protein|nr:hypothetical protein [Bacteroidia bacterium]HRG52296.1 hypothetical protein [Bacteroidia bacterium]
MKNDQEEKKSDKRVVLWILLGLLLVGNGTFGYLWWKEKQRGDVIVVEKEQVIIERENVKSELLTLQDQYATLQTNDSSLQAELDQKRTEIARLIEEADKHKGDAYEISRLKKETETLRKIMKHYVVQIDSLFTINKAILAEKDKVNEDLNVEKGKSDQLSKDRDALQSTVKLGSVLEAENPKAIGVKFKSGNKEIETNKASRAERIKVSFTLGENRIAKKGVKPVYVRIMTPDGKELTKSDDESNLINFNGSRGFYAGKEDVNYNNEKVKVDVFCAGPTEFIPGKYIIEIICDEVVVGQTDITLK